MKRVVYIICVLFWLFSSLKGNSPEHLLGVGDSLHYIQKTAEARVYYDSVLNLADVSDYHKNLATYKIGYSHLYEKDNFLALAYFTEVQLWFEPKTTRDSVLMFLIDREIEVIDYSVLSSEYNIEDIKNSFLQIETHLSMSQRIRLKFLQAKILKLRLNYKEAINIYQEILLMPVHDRYIYENSYYQIAVLTYRLKDYNETLEVISKLREEELKFIKQNKIENRYLQVLYLTDQFEQLNEFVSNISDKNSSKHEYEDELLQRSLILYADAHQSRGFFKKADSLYSLAERKYSLSHKLADNYVFMYNRWAKLKQIERNDAQALELIEKGERIVNLFEVNPEQFLQLAQRKALILRNRGDIEEAIVYMDSVYNNLSNKDELLWNYESKRTVSGFLRTRYYSERLLIEKNPNHLSLVKLQENFKRVCNISLDVYQDADDERSSWALQKSIRYDYENLFLTTYLLYQENGEKEYLDTLLNWAEHAKAMQFKLNLKVQEDLLQAKIPKPIREREKEYRLYLDRLRYSIENEDNMEQSKRKELIAKIPYAKFRYDSIRNVLNNYRSIDEESIFYSASIIQQNLTDDTVVLKYFMTEGRLFIFYISNSDIQLKEVLLKHDITKLALDFRKILEEPDISDQSVKSYKKCAYSLYNYLIQPFQEELAHKHLILVPDYELNLIPFDTFITDSSGASFSDMKYLVHKNAICEVYTLQQLVNNPRGQMKRNLQYVGFAPNYSTYSDADFTDLPGAVSEVEQISKYYKGHSFMREEATKTRFLESMKGKFDIVHLALHTKINDNNPMHSQLLFNDQANPLTLYEIYGINFRSNLLVLSGCNTGKGEVKHGEGVLNLSRAFFFGGIKNIVLTKWAIADRSSAQLMNNFYANLHEGTEVDKSLQQAKINYLKESDPLKHHPYYWAPYSLVGKPLSTVKNKQTLYIAFIFVMLAAIIFLIKKKPFVYKRPS